MRGRLSDAVVATFDGLDARHDGHDTVLDGQLADQAALYGVLDRVQALGFDLVGVRLVPR